MSIVVGNDPKKEKLFFTLACSGSHHLWPIKLKEEKS